MHINLLKSEANDGLNLSNYV